MYSLSGKRLARSIPEEPHNRRARCMNHRLRDIEYHVDIFHGGHDQDAEREIIVRHKAMRTVSMETIILSIIMSLLRSSCLHHGSRFGKIWSKLNKTR